MIPEDKARKIAGRWIKRNLGSLNLYTVVYERLTRTIKKALDDNAHDTERRVWLAAAELAEQYDGHKKRYAKGFDSGAEAWSEDITRLEIAAALRARAEKGE